MLKEDAATIGLENREHQFAARAIDHHFNTSAVDSMIIIVKTELPVPNFPSPSNGDIVRGQVYVTGDIVDNDFANYQIFVTDVNLRQRPNCRRTNIFLKQALYPELRLSLFGKHKVQQTRIIKFGWPLRTNLNILPPTVSRFGLTIPSQLWN